MFSKFKYFFLYCYEAADKMEEKAEVFAAERAKRMEAFRAERQTAEDKARLKIEEIRTETRRQVKEALGKVGVASGEEIAELKAVVSDLAKKVDKLAKK